jgi:Lar family restriction alleviation protein
MSDKFITNTAGSPLKPCPFCGGVADLYHGGGFHVTCLDCGSAGKWSEEKRKAILAWNTREHES